MSDHEEITNTEKDIKRMMDVLNIDEERARFIIALERGDIDGDSVDDGSS